MANVAALSKGVSAKELLVIARPFWWVNTAVPFVAGYFIIGGRSNWLLYFGIVYFAYVYNLVMYGVNDIFDYESDIKNPRKTGIDGSVMSKSKHAALWRWIVALGVIFTVPLYFVGSLAASIWLTVMIFMVLAYSVKGLRFKEVPLLDSATSSFHYTSPFIYALLLVGDVSLYIPAYVAYFVWVMANHAFGAIQDIKPDKAAGIDSVATKLGSEPTLVFVLSCYVTAAVLPVIYYGSAALFVPVLLAPYVWLIVRTLPERANSQSKLFRQGWDKFLYVNYIVGFIFTWYLLLSFNVVSL